MSQQGEIKGIEQYIQKFIAKNKPKPSPLSIPANASPQQIEAWQKEVEAQEQNAERKAYIVTAFEKAQDLGFCRDYSSWDALRTAEAHKKDLVFKNYAEKQEIWNTLKVQIETLQSAKKLNLKCLEPPFSEENKHSHQKAVVTLTGVRYEFEPSVGEYENKVHARDAIFDKVIGFLVEITQVYESHISELDKSPKIKELLKAMEKVCKQAEKLHPTIAKANAEAQKQSQFGHVDIKTAKNYVNAKSDFDALYRQYLTLQTQLNQYTNTNAIPAFPSLGDDTSMDLIIKKEWVKLAA